MLENLLFFSFFVLGGLIFWALILITGRRIEPDPSWINLQEPSRSVTVLGPVEPRLYDWAEDPSF